MIHYRKAIYLDSVSGDRTWTDDTAAVTPPQPIATAGKWSRLFKLNSLPGTRSRSTRHDSSLASSPSSPPAKRIVGLLLSPSDNAIETSDGEFTLNISRYMRNNLSATEKCRTIFRADGFVFQEVMDGLLKMSNPPSTCGSPLLAMIDVIDSTKTSQCLYNEVKRQLKHGALCCRIRLFYGYLQTDTCVKTDEMKFTDDWHFVAVIGVSLAPDGIMLLIQDSFAEKPFKFISLELLREMKSSRFLFYIPHGTGIKMPSDSVFDTKAEDIITAGGIQLRRNVNSCFGQELIYEEEREEEKKKMAESLELLHALLNPDYLPRWARELARARLLEEREQEIGSGNLDREAEEGGFEVQYQERQKETNVQNRLD
jgi:hypothetical protein